MVRPGARLLRVATLLRPKMAALLWVVPGLLVSPVGRWVVADSTCEGDTLGRLSQREFDGMCESETGYVVLIRYVDDTSLVNHLKC